MLTSILSWKIKLHGGISADEGQFACVSINPWRMAVAFGLQCGGTLGVTVRRLEFCVVTISFVVRAFGGRWRYVRLVKFRFACR